MACGISPACSGGVVCGWGGAPRDEWGTRESRGERSSNPAWTAGRGVDVSGLGCLPSARQGVKKCDKDQKKLEEVKYVWKMNEETSVFKAGEEQMEQASCSELTLSRSSLHILSG